jgi:hypothetical protein
MPVPGRVNLTGARRHYAAFCGFSPWINVPRRIPGLRHETDVTRIETIAAPTRARANEAG